jgi:hypothetical protein
MLLALTTASFGAVDVSGVWSGSLEIAGPHGQESVPLFLNLKQNGSAVTGFAGQIARNALPIHSGTLEGSQLRVEVKPPNPPNYVLQLDVSEAAMTGICILENRPGLAVRVELKRGVADGPVGVKAAPGVIRPYTDVRGGGVAGTKQISQADLSQSPDLIARLNFNDATVWPEPSRMPPGPRPADLLKAAMDPGLGIRELHRQGITGKGVAVAIIDQPLLPDHPEYRGRIAAYRDLDPGRKTSMHGPAVTSALAGAQAGTAPDVRVYYVAYNTDALDAALPAQGLDWIVEQNRQLPPAGRIRLVSVSAAPSGRGSRFKLNNQKWEEAVQRAEAEGVLVLDCGVRESFGSCTFRGPERDQPKHCIPGYPDTGGGFSPRLVLAPSGPRTLAEQYERGFGYAYWAKGGQSWALPYAAGVLALGMQIRPELTGKEVLERLFQTAWRPDPRTQIIDPPAFIQSQRASR